MAPGQTDHPALVEFIEPSPILAAAATAARTAWRTATAGGDRAWLLEQIGTGAGGAPTSRIDVLVESAVLAAMEPHRVNILSDEAGWIDRGSALTLIIDPVDGIGNAAAGVPISAFTAALAIEDRFVEGLTYWFDGDRTWWAHVDDERRNLRTSGRRRLDGAIVSLVRPKAVSGQAFLAVAERADRIRVLGCCSLEAALVASGGLDLALDPGSDTHRLVDLAAACVLLEAAGGVVLDVAGRPLTFSTAIERRWSGVCAATPELADEAITLIHLHRTERTTGDSDPGTVLGGAGLR